MFVVELGVDRAGAGEDFAAWRAVAPESPDAFAECFGEGMGAGLGGGPFGARGNAACVAVAADPVGHVCGDHDGGGLAGDLGVDVVVMGGRGEPIEFDQGEHIGVAAHEGAEPADGVGG